MNALFQNKELATQFERDGFVVVPLLNETDLQQIKAVYETCPLNDGEVFDSSSFIEDVAIKESLNNKLLDIFKQPISTVLNKHKILGTSFLTKKNKEHSTMPIHQDWTVVDETKYCSITCWIPLQDTSPENGAIQVIPGSHRFSNALRSPSLPVSFGNIYNELQPFLKTLPLKAGEAFIFNHALMHASHPNRSNTNRVAVTYGFTAPDADLFMYYKRDSKVEKYAMPDNMFINYPKIRQSPEIGEYLQSAPYEVPQLSLEEFKRNLHLYNAKKNMKPLFKDKEQQDFFETNGFIKVPMLETDQVEQLKTLHTELNLKDELGYGFHVGMDNRDKRLVAKMVQEIKAIALPKVDQLLHETQLFTASFVIKEPNPQGVVPPHQDWSFVEDEEEYCSVTCWIPLQDVTIDNGCIGVIKGSNHFFKNHRPSPSPQVDTPLKEHMFTIFPFLDLIEMKAGEALFFNNKTIHASPPNTTDQPRLAVGLGFTQKEAKICHYNLKAGTEDTLLKYQIDADFFLKYDNAQLSRMYNEGKQIEGYQIIDELPYKIDKLTTEEFTNLMQNSGNTYNAPLVGKMAKLFDYNPDGTKKEEDTAAETIATATAEADVHQEEKKSFWQVYTPMNILREIKYRITGS